MTLGAKLYLAFGTSLVAMCYVVALVGWVPNSGSLQVVPTTVRDNPSSFRSSYGWHSGWHAPSSGGGFSFGK